MSAATTSGPTETQVFYCSTLYGALGLAAAIDEGLFGPHDCRRVLIVSDNTPTPEVYPSADEQPGFAAVADRFDHIAHWNDVIAPMHPGSWTPRGTDVPMLSAHFRERLGIDGPLRELALESVSVAPSTAIATLLRGCPITVYSDGLMSYGPTRIRLPQQISRRITRLLYLDLVPGLRPVLLREFGVPSTAMSDAPFIEAMTAVQPVAGAIRGADRTEPADSSTPGTAMIIGQYLSNLDLITLAEEERLHATMLKSLVARGYRHVTFKAHPSAGRAHARHLLSVAAGLDVTLTVAEQADPAEVLFRELRPDLVVGCFSTGLLTAQRYFGLDVASVGTEMMLERIAPYENSNRIPITIVDAVVPRLGEDGSLTAPPPVDLPLLVEAVAYCMQAEYNPHLRASAERYLAAHGRSRYFKNKRLFALDLVPLPRRIRATRSVEALTGPYARQEYRASAVRLSQKALTSAPVARVRDKFKG